MRNIEGTRVYYTWLHVAFFIAGLCYAVYLFQGLPEVIPVHFNESGKPDSWSSNSISWFVLNGISGALVLLFYWIARLIRKKPHLINLPQRDALLALPEEKRRPAYKAIDLMIAQISCIMQVLFAVIQYGTYKVAVGSAGTLPSMVLFAVFGSSTFTIIVVVIHLQLIDKVIRKVSEAELPDDDL